MNKDTALKLIAMISFLPWPLAFYLCLYTPYQSLNQPPPTEQQPEPAQPHKPTCPETILLKNLPTPTRSEQTAYQQHYHIQTTQSTWLNWQHTLRCTPPLQSIIIQQSPHNTLVSLDLKLAQTPP